MEYNPQYLTDLVTFDTAHTQFKANAPLANQKSHMGFVIDMNCGYTVSDHAIEIGGSPIMFPVTYSSCNATSKQAIIDAINNYASEDCYLGIRYKAIAHPDPNKTYAILVYSEDPQNKSLILTDDPGPWLIFSPNSNSTLASLGSPIFEMHGMGEYVLGKKQYEFTNHLGNVMAVTTDRKVPKDPGMDGNIDYYNPDVSATYGYYPFGMPLANDGNVLLNRNVVNHQEGYRYGFQGQEKDDEIKGSGNSINYKYRMHDPRIGRFFAVDPLTAEYPFYSPYAFSGNRVIDAVELEGLEPWSTASKYLSMKENARPEILVPSSSTIQRRVGPNEKYMTGGVPRVETIGEKVTRLEDQLFNKTFTHGDSPNDGNDVSDTRNNSVLKELVDIFSPYEFPEEPKQDESISGDWQSSEVEQKNELRKKDTVVYFRQTQGTKTGEVTTDTIDFQTYEVLEKGSKSEDANFEFIEIPE